MSDPAADEPITLRTPMDVLPWLGESRRGGGSFWVAPQVVNQLAGLLLQHGHLPKSAVSMMNGELDPDKGARNIRSILVLAALNLTMSVPSPEPSHNSIRHRITA
jgi:hypothetical protein